MRRAEKEKEKGKKKVQGKISIKFLYILFAFNLT